ncbi:YifB family Mg chelatase-like AAA ATPase [Staphylococcus chromogenes]|nr:YifB family Mg chelatase-like AAA ATPase [Staphylococcus chromogenes]
MKGSSAVLAKTYSAALIGVQATVVEVEANIGAGLPGVYIVGLADTSISESRDRMKTAMNNSGLPWPKTKVIVNLSPASLPKSGSHFDLSILTAILAAAARDELVDSRFAHTMFLGEVGLDGTIKPVRGVIPALLAAREAGLRQCVVPAANADEAALIADFPVLYAADLTDVVDWAFGRKDLPLVNPQMPDCPPAQLDMADVAGQPEARLAAEIAAAGGHHMMLVGPPGSGKSMIAARLPGLLPALQANECLEASAVHSVVGSGLSGPVVQAPYVSLHHSVTSSQLIGGGSGHPKPGAVSLAHHGVLFLDEVSEIPAPILDSLRTPMETGAVRMMRNHREIVFPAQFQLVLAANTCRCGSEDPTACTCGATARQRYLSNVSGPLRDRIDLFVKTHARGAVLGRAESEPTSIIAERVMQARLRAEHRWRRAGLTTLLNARVNPHLLRREYPADDVAMAYLSALLADGQLSQRGVDRTLKVAWTLTDIAGADQPTLDQVAHSIDLHIGAAELGVPL